MSKIIYILTSTCGGVGGIPGVRTVSGVASTEEIAREWVAESEKVKLNENDCFGYRGYELDNPPV